MAVPLTEGGEVMEKCLLFAGIEDDAFAGKLSETMGVPLSPVKHIRFEGAVPGGGETKPEVLCNVMGKEKECVVIWSATNTNDELVRVCLLVRALKRGEARRITLVIPCFPYARQDKSHGRREPISARWVADVLELSGMDRVIYVDIHADQIEGFFTKAFVRSLWMDNIYVDYLGRRFEKLVPYLIIQPSQIRAMPPDEGAVGSNYRIAKAMQNELAVHLKKRDWSKVHTVTSMGIAGDVVSCLVYTRDDLCASGDSLFTAAAEAKAKGARYVMAIVTHTLGFDKPGEDSFVAKLNKSALDELVTTNSVAYFAERVLREPELQRKISVIDISPYIGKVLGRLGSGQTIRQMMREEKGGDLYRMLFESKQSRDVKASSDMA